MIMQTLKMSPFVEDYTQEVKIKVLLNKQYRQGSNYNQNNKAQESIEENQRRSMKHTQYQTAGEVNGQELETPGTMPTGDR